MAGDAGRGEGQDTGARRIGRGRRIARACAAVALGALGTAALTLLATLVATDTDSYNGFPAVALFAVLPGALLTLAPCAAIGALTLRLPPLEVVGWAALLGAAALLEYVVIFVALGATDVIDGDLGYHPAHAPGPMLVPLLVLALDAWYVVGAYRVARRLG